MDDYIIVGGGVVGLAIARSLLLQNPNLTVRVVDKEGELAAHASGRNSGVLHAGFYYSPDSLKAQLTRRGNSMLREFCADRGIPVRECGKVVVVRSEDELPALRTLLERGRANRVAIEEVSEGDLSELEPLAKTHKRALWSPNTAVADPKSVVEGLAEHVRELGGHIQLGTTVVSAQPGRVTTNSGRVLACRHLINCAGLYADRIAHMFGVGLEYSMLPFKGLYWYADWPTGKLRRHIYPVPDARNPFLGVHLTVTVAGRTKIGPTAIPALSRENYRNLRGLSFREGAEITRNLPRFLTSPHHDVKALLRSELPKYYRPHLIRQAAELAPSVRPQNFSERGRPGIRAQLFDTRTRQLEMDFVVREGEQSTHILNAVSPAWTSSLAFADHVVAEYLMRAQT